MNFDESVKYLYGLGNEVLAMKLGLENIGKLLSALGNPERNYLKIQVAGTNGKGSTCAFIESICVSAGIHVGTTTSPHLLSITERVRVGGKAVSEADFARHASEIRMTSEKLVEKGRLETVPTFFEQVTAIALNYFAEQKISLAVLETGLGGRFDATTAANAEIAVITPIGLDHQRILGDTLEKIAAEKAAIIRPDSRVFSSRQVADADRVIREKCRECGVKAVFADVEFDQKEAAGSGGAFTGNHKIDLTVNSETLPDVELKMLGDHQVQNAGLAALVCSELGACGFEICREKIIEGLENAEHAGRLQFYKGFLLDGAHNVSGAKALASFLDQNIRHPITLIYGSMKDKDVSEIAGMIFAKADLIILTRADNLRSMDVEDLLTFVPEKPVERPVISTRTVAEAIRIAREKADAGLPLVTGSLYIVGEALEELSKTSDI